MIIVCFALGVIIAELWKIIDLLVTIEVWDREELWKIIELLKTIESGDEE